MAVSIGSGQQRLNPLSVKFKATILDDIVKFTVTHLFYNDSKAGLAAADFTFPFLPEYSILDFCCSFGGVPGHNRVLRAIVLEKQTARNRFCDGLKEGKKPGLLEQSSGDVFRSAVGNVPVAARIQTEIVFAGFLKRRVCSDGTVVTRVTIPINISPRYGRPPPEWERTGLPLPPLGLSAELQIHTENSPSMSVKLVSDHQECTTFEERARRHRGDDIAAPAMTVVKIRNKDPRQRGDVVLDIIKGPEPEVPMAWLEAHATKSNYYAAMITLPKDVAQSMHAARAGVKREIIFLADRSGSMRGKIKGLITAMTVFLKGIPQDRYFNVWFFGSRYDALWTRSVQYNKENLAHALRLVKTFKADMGGTELQPALTDIIRTSATDEGTKDVVVLTDGAVNSEILGATLRLVAKAKHDTGGRMRFFALGIGDDVSHALVTGIAQAGGGYADVIGTADYEVWPDRIAAVLEAASEEHLGSVQVQVDAHDIVQPHEASSFQRPIPLQSPADLALLPAFSRNRIFMLFDPQVWRRGPPSSITITTRNSLGVIVRHEAVTIHRFSSPNTLIHRLAARAAIGDLERGESWVQLNQGGPERGSEHEKALTRQEGVRLGREWNLASKWTSFYLEESRHSGALDPFLNTPPQSPTESQKSSSSKNEEHRNSASSSERHDLTPQSPSSDGSPPLNVKQWPKSNSSLPRDSGFDVSRNQAKINDLSSSLGEAFKAHENQRVSSLSHDTSEVFATQEAIIAEAPITHSNQNDVAVGSDLNHSLPDSPHSTLDEDDNPLTPAVKVRQSGLIDNTQTSVPGSATNTVPQRPQDRHSSPTSDMSMEREDNNSIRSWILTDFDVSAPTFNPPAPSAIYEVLEVDSTKQRKANDPEKEKVLQLIDHQNFDGSFNFENPQVAETIMKKVDTRPRPVGPLNRISRILFRSRPSQQRSHNRQSLPSHISFGSSSESAQISLETDVNEILGNDFKMLTKALHDLSQLNPSLPDTMATIVLFRRDLHSYHTLFSPSLSKAYTFVDGFIPDPGERSVWMDYATAILSRTLEAVKPPLPKGKRHVCVCVVCGRVAEEQSYEAHKRAAGGDQNTRNLSRPSHNSFVQDHNNDPPRIWSNSLAGLQADNTVDHNTVLQPRNNTEASSEYITTQYYKEKPRTLDLFERIPEFRDKTSGG